MHVKLGDLSHIKCNYVNCEGVHDSFILQWKWNCLNTWHLNARDCYTLLRIVSDWICRYMFCFLRNWVLLEVEDSELCVFKSPYNTFSGERLRRSYQIWTLSKLHSVLRLAVIQTMNYVSDMNNLIQVNSNQSTYPAL